jgi:hypothetical protein
LGNFKTGPSEDFQLPNYTITKLPNRNMSFMDYFKSLKSPEQRLAWVVAVAADAIQIAGLPLFVEGAISPADTVLDLLVAFVLIRLLGWHWAFLPTLAAELIPGVDLFPTWTAAVWYVTRQQVREGEPEILPPGPAPEPRR